MSSEVYGMTGQSRMPRRFEIRYSGVPNSQTRLTFNAVKKSQVFYYLLQ